MATIIDGKFIGSKILEKVRQEVVNLKSRDIIPTLLTITDYHITGASKLYLRSQQTVGESIGTKHIEYELKSRNHEELNFIVNEYLNNPDINGILVDIHVAPLWIDELMNAIPVDKDVDGISSLNIGRLVTESSDLEPCTALAIYELMLSTCMEIKGKHCVVVGRSDKVGKPIAMMLINSGATVTICHSSTIDIAKHCKMADVIISATGKRNLITADMVSPGVVVIDAGISFNENGKVCGDVDFENVSKVASHITPVPGGVGPVTTAMLMRNLVTATKLQHNILWHQKFLNGNIK